MASKTTFLYQLKIGGQFAPDMLVNLLRIRVVSLERIQVVSLSGFSSMPSVAYCANELHLSANYFGDLVKKECGITAQDYIHTVVIDRAKEKLVDAEKSITAVSIELGFKYPQHFTRLFKQKVRIAPIEYKNSKNN